MHVDDAVPTVVMSTADKSDSSRKSSPITTSSVHGHSHIRTSPTPQQVTLCREREGCDELLYAWSFHSCRVEVSVAIFYKAGVRGVKNADSLMLFLQVSHLLFPFLKFIPFVLSFRLPSSSKSVSSAISSQSISFSSSSSSSHSST